MQAMVLVEDKEEIGGYEFLAFGLATEHMDGQLSIYNVAICKDANGYLEEVPIHKVRFTK